jgi:hypothetical protein
MPPPPQPEAPSRQAAIALVAPRVSTHRIWRAAGRGWQARRAKAMPGASSSPARAVRRVETPPERGVLA